MTTPGRHGAADAFVRIAVVDSRPLVASGLAQLLRQWSGFDVVLVHSAELGMLESLSRADVDVVLIGIDDGNEASIALLREAIASTDAHVVALVSAASVETLTEVIAAGAGSVVFTRSDYDELARAVRTRRATSPRDADRLNGADPRGVAAQGAGTGYGLHATTELTNVVTHLISGDAIAPPRVTKLSPRETEVLQAVVDGQPTSQIAARLGMSENTVRTHVQKVLRKLGVHSRLEAAALAVDLGLLP